MVTSEQIGQRQAEFERLISLIRPLIEADNGELHVMGVNYNSGEIRLALAGSCSSCAISTVTMVEGLGRIIPDRLPWVTKIETNLLDGSEIEGTGNWVAKQ